MTAVILNLAFATAFLAASIIWARSVLGAIKFKTVYWRMTEFRQAQRPVMFAVAIAVNGMMTLIFLTNTIYFALAALGLLPASWPIPQTLP
ncbi:MAG: hypothetical protein ACKOPE_11940 [Novosphingobium sp.]